MKYCFCYHNVAYKKTPRFGTLILLLHFTPSLLDTEESFLELREFDDRDLVLFNLKDAKSVLKSADTLCDNDFNWKVL